MNLSISKIDTKKNLLAFSAGIDSTALFFLLLKNKTPFDIAIVNYNVREQSKEEVSYAKELAKKYNKQIFIKDIHIENQSNFEKKARDIRYDFFKEIIKKDSYETLITAHQLNDKLEWFFMQLSRGAGLKELISLKEFSQKDNYKIFRPLLEISKEQLEEYLKQNDIKYFIDETNYDEKYKRNYFRKNFSNRFLNEFQEGVKKSFEYLENDINSLQIDDEAKFISKELEIFDKKNDDNINIRIIDKSLKKRGFLLTKAQRNEIIKQKELVVSHKICVNITEDLIYIAPYIKTVMPKKFKEKCRVKKIPKNIRSYIFEEGIVELFD